MRIVKCQDGENSPVLLCGFGQVVRGENLAEDQQNQNDKIPEDPLQNVKSRVWLQIHGGQKASGRFCRQPHQMIQMQRSGNVTARSFRFIISRREVNF